MCLHSGYILFETCLCITLILSLFKSLLPDKYQDCLHLVVCTVVTTIMDFWDVMPYSLVVKYQDFTGISCFHLQSRKRQTL